ncbi:MarR family winged helix-turn-helix transcriptional regulator [Halobacillus sp. BBL2006]|uniref:MarR family winged helix-turn-helix transcriptional regulator n=1 Tax=Halobacillus sp. BBL2006 TaxID=1543706 RepID=UPI00054439F2|nr:MarR family transcriptional regulator [Halobacillus sp. BBL2006]KHE71611.1 MarR family transcriptional regulator [Halobacillus sp. BBL2006]
MSEGQYSESLGYNIHMVSHFIQNLYNEKLSEFDLTHSQAKVIYLLANYGDQTQSDLQKKFHIKASSMNGIIDSLLKHERIQKKSCSTDKRSKWIALTDQGLELHDNIVRVIREIETKASHGLSEEEQKIMVSWLKKMQNNLKPSGRD